MSPLPRRIPGSALLAALIALSAPLTAQAPPPQPQARDSQPVSPAMQLVRQGRRLSTDGRQDSAMALYRQALALDPALADAHTAMGVSLDLMGDYAEARKHLQEAIDLSPDSLKGRGRRTMAISFAFERNARQALALEKPVFDEALAAGKFIEAAEIANELARILLESGDLDGAAAWYRSGHETASKAPDLKPAERDLWDFRWHHAQARVAARRGKAAEAQQHVAMARAALDKGTNPQQEPFFPYLTGYVAFYGGDMKTAIAELQRANQNDPFILSLLAQAYEKTGDAAQGMAYWRKVLALNIHNPTGAFSRPLAMQKVK
jgi:tetratricopeptide (TPR) repeat protein